MLHPTKASLQPSPEKITRQTTDTVHMLYEQDNGMAYLSYSLYKKC